MSAFETALMFLIGVAITSLGCYVKYQANKEAWEGDKFYSPEYSEHRIGRMKVRYGRKAGTGLVLFGILILFCVITQS